jgi:hypothetical protein
LYKELAKINISPYEADKLELWQIASLFDENENESSAIGTNAQSSGSLLRARVDAARQNKPPPEAQPVPDEMVMGIMNELGGKIASS